jgi:hypothetical protein
MSKKIGFMICGVAIALQGCASFFERGFRSHAVYLAPRSGYRVEIIALGVRELEIGNDPVLQSHRFMQICPVQPNHGKPLRVRIVMAQAWTNDRLVSEDFKMPLKPSDPLLSPIGLQLALEKSGFTSLDTGELKDLLFVLRADSPLDTFTLDQLTVQKLDNDREYQFNWNRSQDSWIPSSEIPPCT